MIELKIERPLNQQESTALMQNCNEPKNEQSDIKILIKKKMSKITQINQKNSYETIITRRKKSNKLVWSIFFVISVCLFSFMIFKSVKNYLKYDVITKIANIHEIPIPFPTISICNIDPFVTQNASKFIYELYKNKVDLNLTKENWLSKETLDIVKNTKQLILSNAFDPDLKDDTRKSFGFMLEDILHQCKFNLNECSAQDFSWYYSYDHGNCFQFNSGFNDKNKRIPLKSANKPGEHYGLHLKFVLGISDNFFNLAESNGLKIFIHNNSFEPLSTDGVEVELSKLTNIRIKKSFFHKSPTPYSTCSDTISIEKTNSILYKHIVESNKVYRQSDCIDLCLQRYIIENCGCYYLRFEKLFDHEPCLNLSQIECTKNHYAKFLERNIMGDCSADCPLECDTLTYDFSMSSSNFPTEKYYEIYKKDKSFIEHNLKDYNISFEDFRKRALSINIFYPQLKYSLISEIPKTSIVDLFSTIGGELGLFLGMSILSFIEIIQILFETFFIILKKKLSS